ncbi:MAG: flippase-like domain-containing protein [Clostridia bacterium]|nr:flippase-like domain-containing protein [Clostridia bacterium]
MVKISKQTRSNILNALVIFLTIGIVIYLGAANGEIGNAWNALVSSDLRWIGMAFVCYGIYLVFESLGVHVFFRQQGFKPKFGSSLLVSIIGLFYSSVTPAATGGQPMQVFAFKKRGIPPGVSSSALAVKFFCFQVALLGTGLLLWVLNPQIVSDCFRSYPAAQVMVITGFVLNGFTVVAVLLLAINKNIVRAIITFIIFLGKKLRIVKDPAGTASRMDATMADFHASVDMVTHHPGKLMVLLLISVIQVMGLMSISYCVYRAFGLRGHGYGDVVVLQFLLFIGASFTPLPGASGAQEGGFAWMFGSVFPSDVLFGALLLWRFMTYYLNLLIGLGCVIYDRTVSMKKHAQKNNTERTADDTIFEKGQDDVAQENEETVGYTISAAPGCSEEAD